MSSYLCSTTLAANGAKVAVLGRNTERGEARVRSIQKQGGNAGFFSADALDQNSLKTACEALSSRLGAPTILVNAAGGNDPRVTVTPEHPFEEISPADWRESFDMNLVATLKPLVRRNALHHHEHTSMTGSP